MGSVRASYCKGAIAAAKREPAADRLLSAISPVRDVVREASLLGWVDEAVYLRIVDATLEVLGPGDAERFWSERLQDAFRLPLLRPLVEGGLGLFGRNPGSLLRLTPQAYRLTYRGLGQPVVEIGDGEASLHISGLPPSFRGGALIHNFRGHARAALDYVAASGEVDADRTGLSDGALTLRVRWG